MFLFYLIHKYLGEWEMFSNPNFNCTEFGTIRNMAGSNNFVLSVKTWIELLGWTAKRGLSKTLNHLEIPLFIGELRHPKSLPYVSIIS